MDTIRSLSDEVLLEQCVKFGREALLWRNKFRALLPEVERRRLYRKKGYKSVYEFGERLAGLSMAQVAESLNVAERLENKPALKNLLESGEVSVNKIVRVVSIATVENDGELAEKVQILSKNALEVFVRDVKLSQESALESLPGQTIVRASHSIELDCDVERELLRLQEKGIDINQLLREILNKRKQEIMQNKGQIAKELPESSSRYIPAKVRNVIQQEYGNICASERCMKPSTDVHHTRRFGLNPSHDPNFLAPLCKEHHQIAHSLDVKYQELRRRG
ncbi:MAG: hypothetical protein NTX63_00995 [Candidatus Peregrinibacteria bacterium]|nr:hypothetical protein [Candidatus Peregrinibacteria bacterium]